MYDKDMQCTVLIAGAGPTGLTLACDLARRGVALRLVDAAPSPFEGSRGKGLQPRTLEVFEDLGVIEELLRAGAPYPKFRTHFGPFSLRAGSLGSKRVATEAVPYPNVWMVPQNRTEGILRERLRQLGGSVTFGHALTGLRQDEGGVDATLSTGETIRADYLIGCDGGHSFVRQAIGERLIGESLASKESLVADVEIEALDRHAWHLWPLAKGGVMGLCPLPATRLFQLTAPATALARGMERAVQEATGSRVVRVAWCSIYRPQTRMVERYRRGRIFLAGDAAHVHPPDGGQGLNTGVQDAYNLGWKLALVSRGAPDALLDTYEAERRPVAAAVLGLSKRLHETRSLRRGDATNQLSLHYRASPLSSGAALGDLHPGDRMPDQRLADGTRLFDHLRGPQATVFIAREGQCILVRPDGYVASIGPTTTTDYWGEGTHVLGADGRQHHSPAIRRCGSNHARESPR